MKTSLHYITFLCFLLLLLPVSSFSQNNNVGIGTLNPKASALLDVDASPANNKGILVPRLTALQRLAIPAPANSLLVFDTDSACFFYWNSLTSGWKSLCNGAAGAAGKTGSTGAVGNTGSMGNTGSIGSTGFVGSTGGSGAEGNTGSIGITGNTGSIGLMGNTGSTGAAGIAGNTGNAGYTGATGVDGALNAWSLTGNAGTSLNTNFIGTTDNVSLWFRTNNTQQMIIDPMGNIGIGTAAPASLLHISKTGGGYSLRGLTLEQTDAASEIGIEFRNGAASAGVAAALTLTQGGTEGMVLTTFPALPSGKRDINFKPGDVTSVTFKEGGNVGIGTANPGAKLGVQGSVKIVDGTQGAGKVLTSDASGLASWQTAAAASAQATDATALTTSSTAWVDMTSMAVTVTTSGGNLSMSFTTQAANGTASGIVAFRFTVDGVPVTAALYGNAMSQTAGASTYYQQNISAAWLASGVPAGSHTVKMQWRVNTGTAVGPEVGEESDRTLVVIEVK